MITVRLPTILILILGLQACSSTPNTGPGYTFDEVRVVNNSNLAIKRLTVSTASATVVDCGDIAALGYCSKRIGRRNYPKAPFTIAWMDADNAQRNEQVNIEVPAYNAPGNPLYAEFEISPEGLLSGKLVQKIPP